MSKSNKTIKLSMFLPLFVSALCFGLFRLVAYLLGIDVGFGFGGGFSSHPFVEVDLGVFIFDLLNVVLIIGTVLCLLNGVTKLLRLNLKT